MARCTGERVMAQMDLAGRVRSNKRRTTIPADVSPRPADLVERSFAATGPTYEGGRHQYVATWSGFAQFVIDVFSRRIVGWRVATTLRASPAFDALEMAICASPSTDSSMTATVACPVPGHRLHLSDWSRRERSPGSAAGRVPAKRAGRGQPHLPLCAYRELADQIRRSRRADGPRRALVPASGGEAGGTRGDATPRAEAAEVTTPATVVTKRSTKVGAGGVGGLPVDWAAAAPAPATINDAEIAPDIHGRKRTETSLLLQIPADTYVHDRRWCRR